MRPTVARVTVANPVAYVRLDQYHGAALAVQAVIEGGALTPAQAYLARTVGGNEGGNAANITTLINGLVSDGVWSNLDALYVFAQQNAADSLLNLVGTSYGITGVGGSYVFTAYRGYSSFQVGNGYLQTTFNPATATSPNFTQNSANFGVWTNADIVENYAEIGNSATGAVGESHIFNDYTGGLFYPRVNNPSVGSVATPGTAGLFVADRPSSATVIPYWNGVAQTSQSSTSQAPLNGAFSIGQVVGSGGSSSGDQFAAAHIGASLGSAGNLALYNRLRTYMTAVGAP